MQANVTTNITKWELLTWPVNDAYSEPGHKHSFSLDVEHWVAPNRTQWIYGTDLWPWLSQFG